MKAKHILSKPGEFTTVTKIENGMVTLSKNIEGSELKGQITLQEFYRLYDIVEYIKWLRPLKCLQDMVEPALH